MPELAPVTIATFPAKRPMMTPFDFAEEPNALFRWTEPRASLDMNKGDRNDNFIQFL
jgi:hypothetical protein